ncbi:MAG TPA: hypothetical protein VKC60_07785 [Opitutaceae bacterium]|nr:hypothetical protein [Opitutaceae bacterium]
MAQQDRFPCVIHPEFEQEMEALADRGFNFEVSIGRALKMIDDLFVNPEEGIDPKESWLSMPPADQGRDRGLDLRCIDPDDGRITLIATLRGRTLYLASAGLSTNKGRATAVLSAIKRVSVPDWCPAK